jgi:hypothetical protein
VPIYRLHDTTGDDLGLLEHPAPTIEPGDVVVVADGREAIVTARVEAEPGWGQLVAQLLRHKSVGTTQAYLHPTMDDLKAAMEAMDDPSPRN